MNLLGRDRTDSIKREEVNDRQKWSVKSDDWAKQQALQRRHQLLKNSADIHLMI